MYRRHIKRILDVMICIIALPFWLLLCVIIIPLIYLEDRGNPFYNALRLGKNGKLYKMYKFRSMKINAEDIRNEDGTTYNSEGDLRLTRIGKFIRKTSIDETPQLLNVLKGDMSLIGPRPDLPDGIKKLTSFQKQKLDVLPGITGYSQAYYRNNVSLEDRYKQDVYYVNHISFFFDIKIFVKTVTTILFHKNIYRNE